MRRSCGCWTSTVARAGRRPDVDRRAAHDGHPASLRPVGCGIGEAALADAGRTAEEHQAKPTCARVGERPVDRAELGDPAHEGGHLASVADPDALMHPIQYRTAWWH
jgi:hypothetical protein